MELYQYNVLGGIHGHTPQDLFYINSWPISSFQKNFPELRSGNSKSICPYDHGGEDINTKLYQTLWNSYGYAGNDSQNGLAFK